MPRQAWSRAGTRIRTLMMMGVDPSKDLRNKASFVKEVRVKAYTVILRSPCIASRENPQLMQEGWLIGGQPGQEKTTFWKGTGTCLF